MSQFLGGYCRHVRRSHRRYTQINTRRGGESTARSFLYGKRLAKLCTIDFSNYWNRCGIWVFLVHFKKNANIIPYP